MKNNLLLYVGTGVWFASIVLGLAAALAYVLGKKVQDFKYGVFYTVFALVSASGYCLALIAFFFQFLAKRPEIPLFLSVISLGFIAGLIVLSIFVKKDNRILFAVLSIYPLFTLWLSPIFLWNMVYLVFIARKNKSQEPELAQTNATPAA